MSIRLFYDRWPQYNRRLVETIRPLDAEALALRAQPEHWPVWAHRRPPGRDARVLAVQRDR